MPLYINGRAAPEWVQEAHALLLTWGDDDMAEDDMADPHQHYAEEFAKLFQRALVWFREWYAYEA